MFSLLPIIREMSETWAVIEIYRYFSLSTGVKILFGSFFSWIPTTYLVLQA